MFKKILTGLALAAIACAIAGAGYTFGQHLAGKDKVSETSP